MPKLNIALYGANGHQIHNQLANHPHAQIVAVTGMDPANLPDRLKTPAIKRPATLANILADPDIDLVSLCSPRRADQAEDAIAALRAGKHVYAEKPSERDLDRIIQTSRQTGRIYHEMASSAFDQPYITLRKLVESGVLGTVVQVYSQKSYPWHERRIADEAIDGGLAIQAGIYNARFVEHVAGVNIKSVIARETQLGNPPWAGQCRRAVSWLFELENGGLSSGITNYLCPPQNIWGNWGYETLRIWGTNGFAESIDSGRIGTLALVDKPPTPIDFSQPVPDFLEMFIDEIHTGRRIIPFSLEKELSPTRWVIRGKRQMGGIAGLDLS
jgi:predicted dehydrogenase